MAWNHGGLNPKYWTRWRYFKEIQLWEVKETIKFVGMILITIVALVAACVIAIPKSLYQHFKEERCHRM